MVTIKEEKFEDLHYKISGQDDERHVLVQFKIPFVSNVKKKTCNKGIPEFVDLGLEVDSQKVGTSKKKVNKHPKKREVTSNSETKLDQEASQFEDETDLLPRSKKKVKDRKIKGKRVSKHSKETFNEKTVQNNPLLIHSFAKSFTCVHCNEKFSQRLNLKKHLRMHFSEKTFVCEHCDKSFPRQHDLNKHLNIHYDIKPYSCEHCHKSFNQVSILNRHLLIHSGVKGFTCEFCKRKFTQKSNLFRHIPIHSGIKPFTCEYCNKDFSRKPYYDEHMAIHSGVKSYICDFCPKWFAHKSSFIRHNSKFHASVNQKIVF